jgi:putative ABC transport system permease protein
MTRFRIALLVNPLTVGIGGSPATDSAGTPAGTPAPPKSNARIYMTATVRDRDRSSRDRTRTCDPAINSRLLYQLSYAGIDGKPNRTDEVISTLGAGRNACRQAVVRLAGPCFHPPDFPMPISPRSSLVVGLDALRANPLRTLLSTLGVVMGVAAMVSVLSMGDGVERFARQEIERTTDLLGVSIASRSSRTVDGLQLPLKDAIRFRAADAAALAAAVEGEDKLGLVTSGGALATLAGDERGMAITATMASHAVNAPLSVVAGRFLADGDTAVIVLAARAARVVAGDSTKPELAVGRTIRLAGNEHTVVGVVADVSGSDGLVGYVPVDDAARTIPGSRNPTLIITAADVESVDSLRAATERWAAATYGPAWKDRLSIASNQSRVAQAATAMLIFKLLMGAITGVSLLVGGIGIMNVLLAAVAERTREIGIRKATGARDRDILVQFLSESVAITAAGAAAGVALGLGIAAATAAIMRAQTEAEVHMAVTSGTVLFAAGAAVFIGLVFGLYPALRASRLSPIDAIRHE